MWAFGQCCHQTQLPEVTEASVTVDQVVKLGGKEEKSSTPGIFNSDPRLLSKLAYAAAAEDPTRPPPPTWSPISPRLNNHLSSVSSEDSMVSATLTEKEAPPAPVDFHELRWLNYVLKTMWPKMRKVVQERVAKELRERLQIQIDLHPQLGIKDCSVDFDPGDSPPELLRLRSNHCKAREELEGLQLQAEVEWRSGDGFLCKPELKAQKGIPPIMMPFDFALTRVEVRGMATVVLAPLTEELPCFGAMQAFFFDPPDCKMWVTGLKGWGAIGKLLAGIMKTTLVSIVMDSFVLPHRQMIKVQKDVPLETLVQAKSPLPLGLLEIEILEAEHLLASDTNITGQQASSDPYVEVSVGDGKIRTSTVHKTLSPSWKDGPDYLFVYSLNQLVRVEVFDDDVITEDDQLGWITGLSVFWLCKDMEGHPEGRWFDITGPTKMQEDAGRLKFRARFLPLNRLGEHIKVLPKDIDKGRAATDVPNGRRPSVDSGHTAATAPAIPNGASNASSFKGSSSPGSYSTSASSHPHVITVKLLGLEGEHTRHLVGAFCKVEWLADYCTLPVHTKKNLKERANSANSATMSVDTPASSATVRVGSKGTQFLVKAKDSVLRGLRKAVKTVEHAVDSICAGQRENGVATLQRSGKAMPWSQLLHGHRQGSTWLPPMVVRSVEQLHNREGWDLDRIAQMFGLEPEAVKSAAQLRANFEVVWHQSLNFMQFPSFSPFEGAIRLTLHAPKHVERMRGVPDLKALGIMDDQHIIGTVVLQLGHPTVGDDLPWRRRVREVLRRNNVQPVRGEDVEEAEDGEEGDESLVGEGQAETAGLGNTVPGVLIEFMVEVRSVRAMHSSIDDLLADTEKEDREVALQRSRMRGFEIISM